MKVVRNTKARLIAGDPAYITSDTTTHEGAPAWTRQPKEKLVMTLLTNTMEPTFYARPEKLATDALEIHREVLDLDSDFYMKALVYARTEGRMRIQPILGMVLLTTKGIHIPANVFNKVLATPKDVEQFIDLCRNAKIRDGMGQKVKTLLNQWLASKISQYWTIKYANPIKQAIKLSHPKMDASWERPVSMVHKVVQKQVVKITSTGQEEVDVETDTVAEPLGTAKDLVDFIMKKDRDEPIDDALYEKLPQIKVYEDLKRKVYNEEEITIGEVKLAIHEARLPHEAVTGMISPTKEIWKEVMYKMPYFALLRHLETLNRMGVFEDIEALQYACDQLADPHRVERSNVLPYRFYIAFSRLNHSGVPNVLRQALESALEASFQNIPNLMGPGCIAIDVSGSMSSYPDEEKKGLKYIDIAATFGIPLMMKSPDALVLPFDYARASRYAGFGSQGASEGLYPDLLDRDKPMLWNIHQLSTKMGGGTDCSLPIRYLEKENIAVDWFVGITDEEEWGGQRWGDGEGWLTAWRRYKQNVAPEAKAFLVTIAPYGHKMYPFEEPDVYQIFGWSDQVIRFIHLGISGLETQLEHIHTIPLEADIVEIG